MVRFKNRHLTVHVKQWREGDKKRKKGTRRSLEGFSRKNWFDGNDSPLESHESTGIDKVEIRENDFFEALVGSLQINFGDFGLAMNMTHLHCYKDTSKTKHSTDCSEYTFVVRCSRDFNTTVHAAITLLSEIDGRRVVCSVVKKQGVIRNTKDRSYQNKHDLKLEERSKDPTKLKARKIHKSR